MSALPEGHFYVRARKGRRGSILPVHVAPPSPYYEGMPAPRALCGSEPDSGFAVEHEVDVIERMLTVCERCTARLATLPGRSA